MIEVLQRKAVSAPGEHVGGSTVCFLEEEELEESVTGSPEARILVLALPQQVTGLPSGYPHPAEGGGAGRGRGWLR